MSANSASNLKSRLRVVPIDVWSTREKLCLASSVLKSGDQNWSSVSRPLRSFGEPNRPNDWFHQKYCAIQYQDLLEKIETETPKRKRSERGEETPQTVIVKNLTKQRVEELKDITQRERDLILKLKHDLELIRNKQMDEKRFQELCSEMKEKEVREKEQEVEHKKWLEEREVKIAQMTRKGNLQVRRPAITPTQTPTAPAVQSTPANTSQTENAVKSPVSEPLKVEVESEANAPTPTPTPTTENKLTIALTSPSSSPLLTSLLQSPTPSTPTLLSPNAFSRQKPLSQVSSPITPVTRRPSIHSSPEKVVEVKAIDKSEPIAVTPVVAVIESTQNEPKTTVESSKPIKPTESPTICKSKAAVSEVKDNEPKEQNISENKESEQTVEKSDQTKTSATTADQMEVIESQPKTIETKKDSEKCEEIAKKDDPIEQRVLRSSDKTSDDSKSESNERKDENKESEKVVDKRSEGSVEKVDIKQELMETSVEEADDQKEDSLDIKEELTESGSGGTGDESVSKTPSTRNNSKRLRKTPNAITITPTAMRRSRRVALKDAKSATDDSTEMSDQSAANTPQAVKKRGSIDDTTETSMSEESMDAKIVATPASVETVPNSPASVRTEDMDNSKEYRTWKKAVMVNWRLISAHKNASLFSHPVTEAEAKGYEDIVHRPIDLNSIKKRVENGAIRTTGEYQRDMMLMFQNAIMFNNSNHDVHQMAVDMQKDTIATIEEFIETRKHDNQTNESKLRARDRRSNASNVVPPFVTESEISGRRKSRGASTDTDSNASGLTKSVTKKKKT